MAQAYNLVFSDGTGQSGVPDVNGNPSAGATNIYKMYLAANQVGSQTCFYDPGLGTDPQRELGWITWGKNLVSKATGMGITRNIRETYEFLIMNDAPDRRIGLFGFSRGAYTVRSLGGLLGLCGIPAAMQGGINIRGTAKAEVARRNALMDEALAVYQNYGEHNRNARKANGADYREKYMCREALPHIIGVYDTVEALGLPSITGLFSFFKHAFHDAELNPKVPFGFQALSIDENRAIFSPQIWDQRAVAAGQNVEQVWFPGDHSDSGGGHNDRRL
ncbi:MAG: phospholipase effector Tle1 domain-containing protein, partial [Bosea sp. (in: a-proteobacteria)]